MIYEQNTFYTLNFGRKGSLEESQCDAKGYCQKGETRVILGFDFRTSVPAKVNLHLIFFSLFDNSDSTHNMLVDLSLFLVMRRNKICIFKNRIYQHNVVNFQLSFESALYHNQKKKNPEI